MEGDWVGKETGVGKETRVGKKTGVEVVSVLVWGQWRVVRKAAGSNYAIMKVGRVSCCRGPGLGGREARRYQDRLRAGAWEPTPRKWSQSGQNRSGR